MKKMLVVSLVLILALAFCPPALAESKSVSTTQVPVTPPPATTTAPVDTDPTATTNPLSAWENPTPEQTEETQAVYQRFVTLCQERGETISDTAFALNPEGVASFGMVYQPMEGVQFTGIPVPSVYYLSVSTLTDTGWDRHRALLADMVRAIDPTVDAASATRIVDTAWEELSEAHPDTGVMDGHFEEGAWGYTVIRSGDGEDGSTMLMAQPTIVTEGLPFAGPLVLHMEVPQPEDARVTECRATFRSLVEALGMELLPEDEPVEAEIDGLLYSSHLVTDTVEWTDLFDLEDGRPLAHYALHKGQDTTKQGVSDLTLGVLQAAIMAAADVAEEKAVALVATLIDSLEEETKGGRLVSEIKTEDGRTIVLRAGGEMWSVLISRND